MRRLCFVDLKAVCVDFFSWCCDIGSCVLDCVLCGNLRLGQACLLASLIKRHCSTKAASLSFDS